MTKCWLVNERLEKQPMPNDKAGQEAVYLWKSICGDRDPDGVFICTRQVGHSDIHVAGTAKGWICSWEDVQGLVGSTGALYVPPPTVPSSPKKACHGLGAATPPNPWQQNIAMPVSPQPADPSVIKAVPVRKAYRCNCGSRKTYGTLDYKVGHSDWCKGHPDREMENEVYD